MPKTKFFLAIFLLGILPMTSCRNEKKSKGFNYEQHRKEDSERMKETRKRNKKTKSLLKFKGKSVKKSKPEMP